MKLIYTESGAQTLIDEDNKTFKRVNAPLSNQFNNDNIENPYIKILSMNVGDPLQILWEKDGVEKVRVSTPIIKIENW